MRVIFKKPKWSPLLFAKLVSVVILTHLFGLGWGLIAVVVIDSLPSIIKSRN